MILVGQMDSPFLRRVAVTMTIYGMAFEQRSLSVFGDFEELKTVNPLGKVPALVLDDGETLFDSQMILDFVDETAGPERALTPPSGEARRRVLRLCAVALGIAEKVVQLNIETSRRADGTTDPAIVRRFEDQARSGLGWLEQNAETPWLTGPNLTQADVTTASALTHLIRRRPGLFNAGALPGLAALLGAAEALPAFKDNPFPDD